MNDAWRQVKRDFHEAQAEALSVAIANVAGVLDMLPVDARNRAVAFVRELETEMRRNEDKAKLVSAA
jgi:hypothetical protein